MSGSTFFYTMRNASNLSAQSLGDGDHRDTVLTANARIIHQARKLGFHDDPITTDAINRTRAATYLISHLVGVTGKSYETVEGWSVDEALSRLTNPVIPESRATTSSLSPELADMRSALQGVICAITDLMPLCLDARRKLDCGEEPAFNDWPGRVPVPMSKSANPDLDWEGRYARREIGWPKRLDKMQEALTAFWTAWSDADAKLDAIGDDPLAKLNSQRSEWKASVRATLDRLSKWLYWTRPRKQYPADLSLLIDILRRNPPPDNWGDEVGTLQSVDDDLRALRGERRSSLNETQSMLTANGFTPAIERLLGDLIRYANDHPNYRGNLDRVGASDEVFKLRYYPPKETEDYLQDVDESQRDSIRESRQSHNDGVRALDSIAGRIKRLLEPYKIRFPEGVTDGASVMAWALSDRLVSPCGKYQRGGVTPDYRPFEAVRERLLKTLEGSCDVHRTSTETVATPKAKKTKKGQRKAITQLDAPDLCACLMDARIWDLWEKSGFKGKTNGVELFLQKHQDVPHDKLSFKSLGGRIRSRRGTPCYGLRQLEAEHANRIRRKKMPDCQCFDFNSKKT